MAIHYDPKTGRFKQDGRFVSKATAMRSSIARREYEQATAKGKKHASKPAPAKKPAPVARPEPAPRKRAKTVSAPKQVRPVVAKSAPPSKAKSPKPKPAPVRVPKPAAKKKPQRPKIKPVSPSAPPGERIYPPHIGEQEGIIEEFPEEWFPDPGSPDDFDWDDIDDIWGDYEDSDVAYDGVEGDGA